MKITQEQLIRQYNETHREDFEPALFERDDEKTIESIKQILLSCERDKYYTLKLMTFDVIYNYEEIYNILRSHEEKRKSKNDKTENVYNFINIKDTDMILIRVNWFIRHNGVELQEINKKTVEVVNPEEVMEVLIAVPRFVDKYYFRLGGNYYTATFQIVDGSTYNNTTSNNAKVDVVSQKTIFMPIRVFKSFRDMHDLNSGEIIKVTEYHSIIFNNTVNIMYYFLACFGIYNTCNFLEIDCVYISREPNKRDDHVCFCKNDIYISCPKVAFTDYVVQSLVATIYSAIKKDTDINDLFNIRFWLSVLGAAYKNSSTEKGLFVLDSVDGIYDNITKENFHLPMEDKENIYQLLLWMIREFATLRLKENTNIKTKRVRISDCIASIYANRIARGIFDASNLGRKITLKKVKQCIYTQPMYIINNMPGMSNLFAYRDMVNDMDAMTALKFTYKGISGIGENNSAIQPIYRYVDPSHIGILDLDSSTQSDPGMTGMICPMVKLQKDGSFTDYEEPNGWRERFKENCNYKKDSTIPIQFTTEQPKFDYNALREQIVEEDLELNRVITPIYNVDSNILYTHSGAVIEERKQEKIESLFKIKIVDDEQGEL